MSEAEATQIQSGETQDTAPGDEAVRQRLSLGVGLYLLGLALAAGLTAISFWAAQTPIIYGPSIPLAISALALAQMGVHLVFFLHITSAPDNTNNILALGFGFLIVCIIVLGSLWIMAHLGHNVQSMSEMSNML